MPPFRKNKKQAKRTEDCPVEEKQQVTAISGQLQKKLNKKQKKVGLERGVVFVKHLPHGFFEDQLKNYFQQFGKVTRLRLSRSKRTGGSKGFAFIEFEYPEVAQVAAETMDNYLMFKKIVKAKYIPPEDQRFNYFKSSIRRVKNKAGKLIYVSGKTRSIQRKLKEHNNWNDNNYQTRTISQQKKVDKLGKKYAHLGIDFSKIVLEAKLNANAEQNDTVESPKKTLDKKKKNEKENNKNQLKLEDLLGNTINDDSDDEDFVVAPHSDGETTSDEEAYGISIDSDEDCSSEIEKPPKKKLKKSVQESIKQKQSNVDGFEKLIKRKPLTGGIKKQKMKVVKKAPVTTKKSNMKMAVAEDMVKFLPKTSVKNSKAKVGKKQKR